MSYDLSNVKANEFEALPPGEYITNVTNAEVKDTKNGTGQYIKVELTVDGPTQTGRKIFTNFNVKNDNPKAVQIGLGQLKAFLIKAKYPTPDKLESVGELNGLRVGVKTKVRKDDQFGDQTDIHYFMDADKIVQHDDNTMTL